MKIKFKLNVLSSPIDAYAKIICDTVDGKPVVKIRNICNEHQAGSFAATISGADLERFAVNILKALKSKYLQPDIVIKRKKKSRPLK